MEKKHVPGRRPWGFTVHYYPLQIVSGGVRFHRGMDVQAPGLHAFRQPQKDALVALGGLGSQRHQVLERLAILSDIKEEVIPLHGALERRAAAIIRGGRDGGRGGGDREELLNDVLDDIGLRRCRQVQVHRGVCSAPRKQNLKCEAAASVKVAVKTSQAMFFLFVLRHAFVVDYGVAAARLAAQVAGYGRQVLDRGAQRRRKGHVCLRLVEAKLPA